MRGISQLLALLILALSLFTASSILAVWYLSVVARYTSIIESRFQGVTPPEAGNCSVFVVVENEAATAMLINLVLVDPPLIGGEWNYSSGGWVPVGEEPPEPVYLEPGGRVVLAIRGVKAKPGQELVVIVKAANGRIVVRRVRARTCRSSP